MSILFLTIPLTAEKIWIKNVWPNIIEHDQNDLFYENKTSIKKVKMYIYVILIYSQLRDICQASCLNKGTK